MHCSKTAPGRSAGITRNTQSEKAKALASQDVEVVSTNSDDVEPLLEAFHVRQHNSLPTSFKLVLLTKDPSVIYALTNFWEYLLASGLEEALKIGYQQGINLATAASKAASLENYIWATLPGGKHLFRIWMAKPRLAVISMTSSRLVKKSTFL